MKRFTTLPNEEWPKGLGRPVALLRYAPPQLAAKLGIRFRPLPEDPADATAALVKTRSGRCFGLVCNRHQPVPGTDVWISFRTAKLAAAIDELLAALGLERDDLLWTVESESGAQARRREVSVVAR